MIILICLLFCVRRKLNAKKRERVEIDAADTSGYKPSQGFAGSSPHQRGSGADLSYVGHEANSNFVPLSYQPTPMLPPGTHHIMSGPPSQYPQEMAQHPGWSPNSGLPLGASPPVSQQEFSPNASSFAGSEVPLRSSRAFSATSQGSYPEPVPWSDNSHERGLLSNTPAGAKSTSVFVPSSSSNDSGSRNGNVYDKSNVQYNLPQRDDSQSKSPSASSLNSKSPSTSRQLFDGNSNVRSSTPLMDGSMSKGLSAGSHEMHPAGTLQLQQADKQVSLPGVSTPPISTGSPLRDNAEDGVEIGRPATPDDAPPMYQPFEQ